MSNEKKQLSITQPQEWIDALVKQYAPVSEDVDLAIQNMGLHIAALEKRLAEAEAENAELRSFVDEVEGNIVDAIEAATEDMQENTHD